MHNNKIRLLLFDSIMFMLVLSVGCQAMPESFQVLNTPVKNAVDSNDIVLSGGTYGTLTYSSSGTSENWITVWGNNSTAECVRIRGNYIVFRDARVEGCDDHGILVTGKHVVVENNVVTRTESDRFVESGEYCSTSGEFGSAIKVAVGGEDIVIRDNEVYENCGEGIAVTRGVNVLVENNYVRDNHNVDIYVDNSHDVTVFQNEIVCDKWAVSPATNGNGISLGQEDYGSEWGKQLHDVSIVQNSITGCRIGIAGFSHIGNLINVNIEGNSIPSGTASQSRAISLLMPNATNVTIINNCVWWLSFTLPSSGVSLSGNYLCASGTNTPQSSSPTPSRTSTPSRTPSPVPSVTKTFTPTFITPSLSPTSTQVVCEKEYDFNHEVRVVTGNRTLRLRAEPNVNSVIVGLLFDTRDQVSGGQPIFIEKVIKDECTGDIWAEFGGYFALRYNGYYGYTDVDPLWFP